MYNTTCKKGKRCINPPDMLKIAIGKKPKEILIFLLMKYTYYSSMNIQPISYLLYGKELENMGHIVQV